MSSEINNPEFLKKLKRVKPEVYRQMRESRRNDCRYVEKRLKVAHGQLELLEAFLSDAITRYDTHNIDPRRLTRLRDALPRMRALIDRELDTLLD